MNSPKQTLAVFMPARNEKKNIGKNVELLKEGIQTGKINHAVIVIDGSSDRTPEIVFEKLGLSNSQILALTGRQRGTLVLPSGFILIHHKQSEGKGRCFLEAVFTLKGRTAFFKNPTSVLVNLDADAVNLKLKTVTGIATELSRKRAPMILGIALEKQDSVTRPWNTRPEAIGFRATRASALEPMLKLDPVWVRTLPRGFGMECALNLLICGKDHLNPKGSGEFDHRSVPRSNRKLLHEPQGKHASASRQQCQREDSRNRFHGDLSKPLHFPGPENLAFHERAKRKNLK